MFKIDDLYNSHANKYMDLSSLGLIISRVFLFIK